MEAVTGYDVEARRKDLQAKVDALIRRRINLFHDALIEREQIKVAPPAPKPTDKS